jgi:hypothetical protein
MMHGSRCLCKFLQLSCVCLQQAMPCVTLLAAACTPLRMRYTRQQPTLLTLPAPFLCAGPNWPVFEPLTAGQLSALLLSHAVHIMPSEREGFGHSINEGRAAGRVQWGSDGGGSLWVKP